MPLAKLLRRGAMQDTLTTMQRAATTVQLRYPVNAVPESWVLTEDKVAESTLHDEVAEGLKLVLKAWTSQTTRSVRIARNLAVRWLEANPRIGIDPDVCVLEPAPPERRLSSLRLWLPGHTAPRLCFEIVSENHPHKDYRDIQDRYAAMGSEELVVFDPSRVGPASLGGPVLLQKWRRRGDLFEREAFGDEPVFSDILGAWMLPREEQLVIADDQEGKQPWLTEAERALAESERAEALVRAERAKREARGARTGAG